MKHRQTRSIQKPEANGDRSAGKKLIEGIPTVWQSLHRVDKNVKSPSTLL